LKIGAAIVLYFRRLRLRDPIGGWRIAPYPFGEMEIIFSRELWA